MKYPLALRKNDTIVKYANTEVTENKEDSKVDVKEDSKTESKEDSKAEVKDNGKTEKHPESDELNRLQAKLVNIKHSS